MVVHPAVFLDDLEARAIISTMDGICIESHQFNRYWPLGNEISNPEEIARGAKWVLEQGLDYIFYYGPYQYKGCETYTDFLERDWLKAFWARGLPKHHENMYYYLNAFPHGCGSQRPVGPESDQYPYREDAIDAISESIHWIKKYEQIVEDYYDKIDSLIKLNDAVETSRFMRQLIS